MPRPYTYVGKHTTENERIKFHGIPNTKAIKEYIGEQLKRDKESDQLSMYDPKDPFMGSR